MLSMTGFPTKFLAEIDLPLMLEKYQMMNCNQRKSWKKRKSQMKKNKNICH
jgi:hypothetical protein